MTFYLGVDPGRTTGAAWVSYRDKQLILHDFEEVKWPDFMEWVMNWKDKLYKFYDTTSAPEEIIVVCEDFIHRKAGPWTPSPVPKQIGVCYGKAYDLGWKFALSQPINKSAGYRIAKLKQESHWGDAYAHVHFAIRQGLDPEAKIIW